MAEKDFVKATVVDIQRMGHQLPEQIALDANVLYYFFYPKFKGLKSFGGEVPREYQLTDYPTWLEAALNADVELATSSQTLGEFARTCKFAELESYWLTRPGRSPEDQFNASVCKQTRYALGPVTLHAVRKTVQSYVLAIRRNGRVRTEGCPQPSGAGGRRSGMAHLRGPFLVDARL